MTHELDPAVPGQEYRARMPAPVEGSDFRWSLSGGAKLPDWLHLEETGELHGMPQASKPIIVKAIATDSKDTAHQVEARILVNLGLETKINLGVTRAQRRYKAEMPQADQNRKLKWRALKGEMPPGLTVSADGIGGHPESPGTYEIPLEAIDADLHIAHTTAELTVTTESSAPSYLVFVPMAAGTAFIIWWFFAEQYHGLLYAGLLLLAAAFVIYLMTTDPILVVKPLFGRLGRWLGDGTHWLTAIAMLMPVLGYVWITIFAYTTKGQHSQFLGVMYTVALASLMVGVAVGFLFGIPKLVSTGELRQTKEETNSYIPSSNLAEISDWLTKLLLGAGLVSLSKLGEPAGRLVDHVAAGFGTATSPTSAPADSLKVMSGAILVAFALIGFIDGYAVTTLWYQRKLSGVEFQERR